MNDGSSRCSWHTWRIIYIYIITFSSIIWYFWTFFFLSLFILLLLCSEVFICSGPCWLHTSAKKKKKVLSLVTIKQKKMSWLVLFNKSANASVRDTSSGQKKNLKKKIMLIQYDACHVRGVRSLQKVTTKSTFGTSSPRPRSPARGGRDACLSAVFISEPGTTDMHFSSSMYSPCVS